MTFFTNVQLHFPHLFSRGQINSRQTKSSVNACLDVNLPTFLTNFNYSANNDVACVTNVSAIK